MTVAGSSYTENNSPTQRLLPVASTKPPVRRPLVPQEPEVTQALAIVLDEECIRRWAIMLYEKLFPGRLASLSPEEAERVIIKGMSSAPRYIAGQVYREFPHIPRLKRNVVMVESREIPGRDYDTLAWLLVFRDNSTRAAKDAPIEVEDIKAVKEFVGVMRQGSKWYDVSRRIR